MNLPIEPEQTRIAVVDESSLVADNLVRSFRQAGFKSHAYANGAEVMQAIADWKPHFILYDLMVSDLNGITFLKLLRSKDLLHQDRPEDDVEQRPRIFITSAHNTTTNVREALRAGAHDYITKPARFEDILGRIVVHLQPKRDVGDPAQVSARSPEEMANFYLHMVELLTREAAKNQPINEILFRLVSMAGLPIKAVRTSLVRGQIEHQAGAVVASSDNRDIGGFRLDLTRYPEILFVLRNEKILVLEDVGKESALRDWARLARTISFNSMVVAPVKINGTLWGVLSCRLADSGRVLMDYEVRFVQVAANLAALVMQNQVKAESSGRKSA